MFADVVKQLTSRHILHNHEEICGCTYHLVPETQTFVLTHCTFITNIECINQKHHNNTNVNL